MIDAVISRPRKRIRALSAALLSVVVLVAACSTGEQGKSAKDAQVDTSEEFGYLTTSELVTTNSGTAFGSATRASQLSGRLYPAAFVPGPSGQLIPNTDLVEAEELPGEKKEVLYTIAPNANFSDGKPVTCVDFLLSFTAGVMSAEFGSNMPLVDEIESFDCAADNKRFKVTFKPDTGNRWPYLFGPGTVMPSHTIAAKNDLSQKELVDALYARDPEALAGVAETWRYGFGLEDFDPELQVSFGPYSIESVGKQGEVLLTRNEKYYGDQANLESVVVWPRGADVAPAVNKGNLRIADSIEKNPAWMENEEALDTYETETMVGELTESLLLSDFGLFSDPGARQAFSKCIDQAGVARVSSKTSGIDVPPVYVHSLYHSDPMVRSLGSVLEPHRGQNLEEAGALSGQTIRIGYQGPNERLAAMVNEIKGQCEPAGITIEDVSAENSSSALLEVDPETGAPKMDAFLGAVDPLAQNGSVATRIKDLEALKKAETELWTTVPDIPLSAEPRTFIRDSEVENVVPYSGLSGIGWNMDRWRDQDSGDND